MRGRTDESTSRPQTAHLAHFEQEPTAQPQPPRPPEDRFVYRLTPKALQVLREHEPGAPLAEPVARTADVEEAIDAEAERRRRRHRYREARDRGRRLGTVSRRHLRGERLPLIRLSGKWLRAAGFDLGQEFEVKIAEGRLVLEVLP